MRDRPISNIATTPVVLRSPPPATKDRLKRKRPCFLFAVIKGRKSSLYSCVSVECPKVPIQPFICRWYLKSKSLKRKTELLVVDEEYLVRTLPRIQVVP